MFREFTKPFYPFVIIYLFNIFPRIRLSILEREEGEDGVGEKESEREREREKSASHTCPDQGSNLQPLYMPWPEI